MLDCALISSPILLRFSPHSSLAPFVSLATQHSRAWVGGVSTTSSLVSQRIFFFAWLPPWPLVLMCYLHFARQMTPIQVLFVLLLCFRGCDLLYSELIEICAAAGFCCLLFSWSTGCSWLLNPRAPLPCHPGHSLPQAPGKAGERAKLKLSLNFSALAGHTCSWVSIFHSSE